MLRRRQWLLAAGRTTGEGLIDIERSALRLVGTYGLAHALVDASCAATVFYASASGRLEMSTAIAAVLTYNVIAFASQPLFGWFLTDASQAREWARVGAAITAITFFLSLVSPVGFWFAVVLAGLGNAIFHLGGGVVSLRVEPGRAALPGLFVAPGAAGLAAGVWMGANQWAPWLPAVALLLMTPFMAKPRPEVARRPGAARSHDPSWLLLAVGILFSVVALRALIGSGLVLPWKSQPALLWALTAAVVLGKASGGILADRFGRVHIGVGALLLSAPLLVAGPSIVVFGVVGMFLFNITMPVTLVALADLLPERPGFAFGLTCLALVMGSLPFSLRLVGGLNVWVAGFLAACSAGLLWGALGARSGTRARVSLDALSQEV